VVTSKDGKPMTLVVIDAGTEQKVKPTEAAFTPDGKRLVVRVDDQIEKAMDVRRTMVARGENGIVRVDVKNDSVHVDGKGEAFLQYFHTAPFVDLDGDGWPDILINDGNSETPLLVQLEAPASANSDAAFLKRVVLDVRGTAPTTLEEKYFTEDKDPKKREKLLETLLKDPAVAKKLGDEWKKKMLATPALREGKLEWKFIEPKGGEWKFVEPKGFEIVPVPAKPKTPQQQGQPLQFELKNIEIIPTPAKPKAPKQEGPLQFELKFTPLTPAPDKPKTPPQGQPLQFELKFDPLTPPAPDKPRTPQQGQPLQFELKFADPVTPVPAKPKTPQQPSVRVVVPDGSTPAPATPRTPQPSAQSQSSAPQPTRLEKLVSDLLAAKKSDGEMLEAVTLATVGRLPTDAEKRLTLGLVGKTVDRKAAWVEVAKALAATEEGTKRGGTEVRSTQKVIEVVVPAAKP